MLDSRPLLPVFCDVQSDDIGVVGVRDAIKRVKDDLADGIIPAYAGTTFATKRLQT